MVILNDTSNPQYKELHRIFYHNMNICRKYYISIGQFKPGMVLHHKIINCDNYEEWKIDEIVPMTKEEHSRLHMTYYKQGYGSKEANIKAHQRLKEKYESGEITIWNKGLTKETDSRIKTSPRKGKTGKDFPFLCASKKGKSGGWNKDISKDDPRYASLKKTPEQIEKSSIFMKENNPMFDPDIREKHLQSVRNPKVKQARRDKMVGRKKYTNGTEVHMFKPSEAPSGYVLYKDYYKEVKNETKN